LLSIPAALGAPLMAARWGNSRLVLWGNLGMALFTLPLALIPNWTVAGLGFMGSTVFFMVTSGPFRLFSQELVAPRWRATMAAAFMLGAGLAFSATSLLGGYAIVTVGYRTLFLIGVGLMVAGALLFGYYFRLPRGAMAGQPASEIGDEPAGS
jgi:MFS family permease